MADNPPSAGAMLSISSRDRPRLAISRSQRARSIGPTHLRRSCRPRRLWSASTSALSAPVRTATWTTIASCCIASQTACPRKPMMLAPVKSPSPSHPSPTTAPASRPNSSTDTTLFAAVESLILRIPSHHTATPKRSAMVSSAVWSIFPTYRAERLRTVRAPQVRITGVEGEDLVVEALKAPLPFPDQLRLEAAVAVPRRLDRHRPVLGHKRLRRRAVAGDADTTRRLLMPLITEMLGQLRRQPPLHQPLRELREHPARPDDLLLGPSAAEQLVDHLVGQLLAKLGREIDRRRAAGRLLRSPYGLAPHPAGEISPAGHLDQLADGLSLPRHDTPPWTCLHRASDTPEPRESCGCCAAGGFSERVANPGEGFGCESVVGEGSALLADEEVGVDELFQVVGDGGLGKPERGHEVADADRGAAGLGEQVDDLDPVAVGEGAKDALQLGRLSVGDRLRQGRAAAVEQGQGLHR